MVVQTTECQSADELLTSLVLKGPVSDPQHKFFLYRGVGIGSGDAEHRLVPSSLRLDRFDELVRLAGRPKMTCDDKEKAQCLEWSLARKEAQILGSFFRFADAQGLPMPEITSSVRRTMQNPRTSDALLNPVFENHSIWPPDELLPLAGQAQHYGLPTRLLDWSGDPLAALYFAVREGMRRSGSSDSHGDSTSCVAVWVLNAELLDFEQSLYRIDDPLELPLTIVTAPASANPNLRAQHGMFTVWRPEFTKGRDQPVERRPLNELIQEAFDRKEPRRPLLYKFTLPLEHVPELWAAIRRNGMNAARLFPDFSGAASAVCEEAGDWS